MAHATHGYSIMHLEKLKGTKQMVALKRSEAKKIITSKTNNKCLIYLLILFLALVVL